MKNRQMYKDNTYWGQGYCLKDNEVHETYGTIAPFYIGNYGRFMRKSYEK